MSKQQENPSILRETSISTKEKKVNQFFFGHFSLSDPDPGTPLNRIGIHNTGFKSENKYKKLLKTPEIKINFIV